MKLAIVFSGQGSQYEGMGRDLASGSAAAAAVYREASEAAGQDQLALSGKELGRTLHAQQATVTLDLAAFAALRAGMGADWSRLEPDLALAGFSLGEYAAFDAAGVMPLPDLIRLTGERAAAMDAACEAEDGAMFAILGLDDVDILMFLMEDHWVDRVFPANYNSPGQVVIAGYEADVIQAANGLKNHGARRAVRLQVSGAFHTILMKPAADALREAADSYEYAKPRYPLFSNTLGDQLPAVDSMPGYMARHMVNPVRWVDEISSLKRRGYTHYIECGPGRVLSGLIRRIDPDAEIANVEDMASLEETVVKLRGWI